MNDSRLNAVTGAFGLSGGIIARMLLARGERVRTLTSNPSTTHELAASVEVAPFNFADPAQLVESLAGAEVLYNTYWIRFSSGEMTFEKAVENSRVLIEAAVAAGVRRIVHYSIANPSLDSDLPYYRGKALVEQMIRESGLSYAILGPTVLFGGRSILINNIAWFLRHLPAFAAPGSGEYGIQPVYVEDLAAVAVEQGHTDDNVRTDVVGPDAFAFNDLLRLIRSAVGSRAVLLRLPPALALMATGAMGFALGDVILTPDEVTGLMRNLLVSSEPPRGKLRLADWLEQHPDVGTQYFSELKRHYR